MNKYQEALENAVDVGIIARDWKNLKELVDKATPKKPRKLKAVDEWSRRITEHYCGKCEQYFHTMNNYCPNCGQAIDWSEEE